MPIQELQITKTKFHNNFNGFKVTYTLAKMTLYVLLNDIGGKNLFNIEPDIKTTLYEVGGVEN